MKVAELPSKMAKMTEMPGKDSIKTVDSRTENFQAQLKHAEEHNTEEKLQSLVNKITEQGAKLADRVDLRELRLYKHLITEFLDEAVSTSGRFSKSSFLDRRGRHKVFAVVKKINSELEELTRDVLSNEKDHIKILQRLDDIRGLILDIIM